MFIPISKSEKRKDERKLYGECMPNDHVFFQGQYMYNIYLFINFAAKNLYNMSTTTAQEHQHSVSQLS